MNASNSAAQVSTSRKVVLIPRLLRSARTEREVALQQVGELGVGEAELLRPAQEVAVSIAGQRLRAQRVLHLVDLAQVVQEPGVDLRQVEDLLDRVARP